MKKIYQTLIALVLIPSWHTIKAQVSNYVFQTYVGTYSPISGGTVFATSTTDDGAFVNPANPGTNSTTGPGIPIGFSFTFNANVYDVIGLDNNGWIAFGQSTLTPNPVNLNNTGGLGQGISGGSTAPAILQNHIAALGRDLVGNGGTASLRVQTIGTAPNRVCVVQWTNYRPFGGSTSDVLNFQIRLNETTNIIDIVYDTWAVVTSSSGQVGLRGNANTDYNNRSVSTTGSWATSNAGTANTDVVNWNTTLMPGQGRVYEWIPPSPCNAAPAANSVTATFSMVCPNAPNALTILNTYTNTGLTYQWYVSDQSVFGPYTVIPTGTAVGYAAPSVTATSWYQLVISCPAALASTTATPYNVLIAPTTTNSVPYYETFEGITVNNQLPNCSWSASSPTTINQTYTLATANNRIPHTGSKFASFRGATATNGDYFYSNGIEMFPGITYSAATWYITDGGTGWTELSLSYGTSQTSTGLTSIASVTGAVTGQFYQLLSGTFQVPSAGLYYIAIKGKGATSTQFLTWDDLSVTIPCALNSPTLSVVVTPSIVCTGQEVNISVTGADTYSWSTGDLGTAISYTPFSAANLTITGMSSLSGCETQVTQMILPNLAPVVSIFTPTNAVCLGSSATLYAFGANSYVWSNTGTAQTTTVAPTVPTSYTVTGSNASGCTGDAVITIGVLPLPTVTASISNPNTVCAGESVTLTGMGATNYQWQSNSFVILNQEAVIIPYTTTVYTLTGTNLTGCSNSLALAVNVTTCVGIKEQNAGATNISLFPNPANNEVTLQLNNGLVKQIEILDITGRLVAKQESSLDSTVINIQQLAVGTYYLKVKSGSNTEMIKLIKN
ncbi:MAG: T9SS type A sorting domain-containing protein [Bacteroidia bacterium]|nr:T9SS type A sorting domain-containing protein [Bacteroidia bacterium]